MQIPFNKPFIAGRELHYTEVFLKIEILVHEAQRKIDEQTNLTAGMSPSGHLP